MSLKGKNPYAKGNIPYFISYMCEIHNIFAFTYDND